MANKTEVVTYATIANFGMLFDIGGARIKDLYMVTTGELMTKSGLIIQSEGKYPVPTDENNIAYRVAKKIVEDYEIKDGLFIKFYNDLKPGGVGLSAAGSVAVVEQYSILFELKLTSEQKIYYASFGEPNRHFDNVLPCVVGGIVVSLGLDEQQIPKYCKYNPPTNLVPAMIIPLDIIKEGGTAGARAAIKDLRHNASESAYESSLVLQMTNGIMEDDFKKIRDSIKEYSKWEKSVTYTRNQRGVYGIDVNSLNEGLEKKLGEKAILTPSGAGPAMLILATEPEIAKRALDEMIKMYENNGHKATGIVTSFF